MKTGEINYDSSNKQFVIRCEPHISWRLRRWFGKLGKATSSYYKLTDTPENARDLEIFIKRFGLELTNGTGEYLKSRADQHRESEETIRNILEGRLPNEAFELAIPAREYQKVAAQIALTTKGLLIGDDVGIGKTAAVICMLTRPEVLPALVVTLTHLTRQWQDEIKKFAPHLKTHIIKRGKPYDVTKAGRNGNQLSLPTAYPDVLIINYHKLATWTAALCSMGIRLVAWDEVQELRRTESLKYGAAREIAQTVEWRVATSATPIFNYGGEFWNVIDCIRPGGLGTREEFVKEWTETEWWRDDKVKIKNPKAFGTYLRDSGLMIRRTREEVGRELPPLTKVPHHIGADLSKLNEVSHSCAELARLILREGPEDRKGQKLQASEELNIRLRQATGVAKAPFVAEFVKLLVESGEKVLVGVWHREVYAILNDKFKQAGLKAVQFSGSESAIQKEASKQEFKGDAQIMLMSLRSGAGLDGLQGHCKVAVIAELDWAWAVMEQFIGRIWRDGQLTKVITYFLIADSGSDPIVADVLGLKRVQLEGVMDPDRKFIEGLTVDPSYIKKLAEAYLLQVNRGAL